MRLLRKKTGPSVTNAAGQVLGTYELLEHILLNLEPFDLRKARLVSKAWHEVVIRSQILNVAWRWNEKKVRDMRMLLLGDPGSGKRPLIERWTLNEYMEDLQPGVYGCYRKSSSIGREKWVIDISCLSRYNEFPAHLPLHIRDTDCYALVYSTTSREGFDSMHVWHEDIHAVGNNWISTPPPSLRLQPPVLLALVATQCDVPEPQRQVTVDEGVELARELGCPFYEISAKTAQNVDAVFESMISACRDAIRLHSISKTPDLDELRKLTKGRFRHNIDQRYASLRGKLVRSRNE